jgi:hypothetical protein
VLEPAGGCQGCGEHGCGNPCEIRARRARSFGVYRGRIARRRRWLLQVHGGKRVAGHAEPKMPATPTAARQI